MTMPQCRRSASARACSGSWRSFQPSTPRVQSSTGSTSLPCRAPSGGRTRCWNDQRGRATALREVRRRDAVLLPVPPHHGAVTAPRPTAAEPAVAAVAVPLAPIPSSSPVPVPASAAAAPRSVALPPRGPALPPVAPPPLSLVPFAWVAPPPRVGLGADLVERERVLGERVDELVLVGGVCVRGGKARNDGREASVARCAVDTTGGIENGGRETHGGPSWRPCGT